MAVLHLPTKFGANVFVQFGFTIFFEFHYDNHRQLGLCQQYCRRIRPEGLLYVAIAKFLVDIAVTYVIKFISSMIL